MRFRATAPAAQHLGGSIDILQLSSWVAPSWSTSRALSADADLHRKREILPMQLGLPAGPRINPSPQAPRNGRFREQWRECGPSVTRMNYAEV
jgi:hypothetical protein